ncbi:hypothetical protein ACIQGZ_27545 [Streptomyces sp. NPDC092296]|uniref:hypothetical protein n=1 Tax=Streptomyces sp. NPDC092296 TaxID=3366012 RepID=UPI0038275207
MPGSVTISRHQETPTVDHADAERLASVLEECARLLTDSGADRLTEAQAAAVCGGRARRAEFAHWARGLAAQLRHSA